MAAPNLSALGGTKFIATIGAGFFTTLLQWHGKLDANGDNYKWVILGTVGAYIGGNVAQAVKDMQTSRAPRATRSTDTKDEK